MVDTRRHDNFFDKKAFCTPVTIIGVGGIGGYIAKGLADLGVGLNSPFEFWDGDTVAEHNRPNQVYGYFGSKYVGQNKADALAECIPLWGGDEVKKNVVSHPTFFEGQAPLSGIVCLAVDGMTKRRRAVESSVWRNRDVIALIETRMNARYCAVNIVDPNDEHHIACWNDIFYSDEEADQAPGCGGHDAVGSTSSIAGNLAVSAFVTMAEYLKNPSDAFLLPNQIELNLKTFEMTTRIWYPPEHILAPSA